MMKLIALLLGLTWKITKNLFLLTLCVVVLFVVVKGNQPMDVPGVPAEMSYFEFMQDRVEAARVVQPSRCGWGMLLTFSALAPVYSVVYTEVGIHPGGFLDNITAPDPNIPTDVAGAPWYQVPDIWWDEVKQISWAMLGKPRPLGCQFRPVMAVWD